MDNNSGEVTEEDDVADNILELTYMTVALTDTLLWTADSARKVHFPMVSKSVDNNTRINIKLSQPHIRKMMFSNIKSTTVHNMNINKIKNMLTSK